MDADPDLSRISLLSTAHDTSSFDCGRPVINSWLRHKALANQHSGDTRKYVLHHDGVVYGFYGIAVAAVLRSALPGPLRRNAPDPVGCVLLAQLGVSITHSRRGLGGKLVLDAMRQAVIVADTAGCRLFAVNPREPDVVSYYEKFGFTVCDTTPPLMAMSLRRVRSTLAGVDASGG